MIYKKGPFGLERKKLLLPEDVGIKNRERQLKRLKRKILSALIYPVTKKKLTKMDRNNLTGIIMTKIVMEMMTTGTFIMLKKPENHFSLVSTLPILTIMKPEILIMKPEMLITKPETAMIRLVRLSLLRFQTLKPEILIMKPEMLFMKPEILFMKPEILFMKPEMLFMKLEILIMKLETQTTMNLDLNLNF
jgi:hypothetical protein